MDGFELQIGLPWSGYVYQPDFCSMSENVWLPGTETVNGTEAWADPPHWSEDWTVVL